MLQNAFKAVWIFLKSLGTKRKWIAVIAAIVIIGGVGYTLLGPKSTDDEKTASDRAVVELIPVSEYALGSSGSSGTGNESVVRAETSGKITRVLPIGTRVSAGTVIAEFENASQQAALLQAEGTLEAARATLKKTQSGLRSEKLAVLQSNFESARSGAVATLLSAYASVDSAVRDSADSMFSNPEGTTPRLVFASSNAGRRNEVENVRVTLGSLLSRQSSVSAKVSTGSDLSLELTMTEDEVRQTRAFIDELIATLNEAIATNGVTNADIASYKASATAARTSLTTSLSSIASARGLLETAKQNLEEGLTGAEATDLAASEASVKQAQGAYDAALAAYRKTAPRASVSGTILACNASVGDVLSVGADVCRIRSSAGSVSGDTFTLPLSSVKYTPAGAFVFTVSENGTLEALEVTTGLVTADGITIRGLFGDEYVVSDVRGLKTGEAVSIR